MTTPEQPPAPGHVRRVSLALQGGGSHGAFTWGVLDALLQDARIQFDGISGASAGAVNAVALAHGLATSQESSHAAADASSAREAARASLRRIWHGIEAMGSPGAVAESIRKMMLGNWASRKAGTGLLGSTMGQWISPYQSNPLDINPLRRLLEKEIDFEAISRQKSPQVFVSATRISTGQAEIFSGEKLTLAAVMASTCLPTLFRAVEIDGESYWDGGFSGNPSLAPLVNLCESRDLIVVQINPLRREGVPQTPQDIMDRVNELTFNASLLSQMRTVDFINHLLADGRLVEGSNYRSVRLHRIDGGEALESLPAASRVSASTAMIESLFSMGQDATNRWLSRHFEALGQQGTVNIRRDYVGSLPQEY